MSRMFHPMHCTKRTTNAGLSPKLVWRAPFARQVERSLRAPTPDGGAGLSDAAVSVLCPVLHSAVAGCNSAVHTSHCSFNATGSVLGVVSKFQGS